MHKGLVILTAAATLCSGSAFAGGSTTNDDIGAVLGSLYGPGRVRPVSGGYAIDRAGGGTIRVSRTAGGYVAQSPGGAGVIFTRTADGYSITRPAADPRQPGPDRVRRVADGRIIVESRGSSTSVYPVSGGYGTLSTAGRSSRSIARYGADLSVSDTPAANSSADQLRARNPSRR